MKIIGYVFVALTLIFGIVLVRQNKGLQAELHLVPKRIEDLYQKIHGSDAETFTSVKGISIHAIEENEGLLESEAIKQAVPIVDNREVVNDKPDPKTDLFDSNLVLNEPSSTRYNTHVMYNAPTIEEYHECMERLKKVMEKIDATMNSSFEEGGIR